MQNRKERLNPLYKFFDLNQGVMPITDYDLGMLMVLSLKNPRELIYPDGCKLENGFLVITSDFDKKEYYPFIKKNGDFWL